MHVPFGVNVGLCEYSVIMVVRWHDFLLGMCHHGVNYNGCSLNA